MKNKLNISIDDMSPHPKSSVEVLDRCFELINVFPEIKFTLFIPMAYTRMGEKSYRISEYPDFCSILKNLPINNFELGWHGYYHGILGRSNNDEFLNLDYSNAKVVLEKMFKEASLAGVKELFKPIFRPSAFRMSPYSFDACSDAKILTLALSQKEIMSKIYCGKDRLFMGRVIYYNINPPFDSLNIYNKMEIVYHACTWDKSYLNINKRKDLEFFIKSNMDNIDFEFMENL